MQLATKKKEEGNALFKERKYRDAIDYFTQGIELCNSNPEDSSLELRSNLYLNIAVCMFYLQVLDNLLKK